MSDYYNNRKKKRSRREKIGFYTACSICLIAVCMAVYSTYNTLSVPSAKTPVATQNNEVKVNENVTGVTQTLPEVKLDVEVPTIAATEEPSTTPPVIAVTSSPSLPPKSTPVCGFHTFKVLK